MLEIRGLLLGLVLDMHFTFLKFVFNGSQCEIIIRVDHGASTLAAQVLRR